MIENIFEVRYYDDIMKSLFVVIAFVVGILAASMMLPSATYAAASCGGVDVAYLECDTDPNAQDPVEGSALWAILTLVLQIMIGAVGLAAVGGLVYAAIIYASAQDNASQVQQAKDIIRNVVIGLVMFLVMWGALEYLIPGGIFS